MIHFILEGQLPSGKNSVKNNQRGHRYPNKRFVLWRADAIGQLEEQRVIPAKAILDAVTAEVRYWAGDRRRRDVVGMGDALCHLLERSGVLADDGQVRNFYWTCEGYDKERPRCTVTLIPLEVDPLGKPRKPRSRSRS